MRRLIHTDETLIAGPTREPLDLEEVKKHLKFTSTSEDTLLDRWISSARRTFEDETARQIMTATWELWLDAFPWDGIELPHPPLLSVERVQYIDTDGTLQTWASSNYLVKSPSGPQAERGWIEPAYGVSWPSTRCESGAVRVRFVAGYGPAPADVPDPIQDALYLLVAHRFGNRSQVSECPANELPLGVPEIIRAYRSDPKRLPCV